MSLILLKRFQNSFKISLLLKVQTYVNMNQKDIIDQYNKYELGDKLASFISPFTLDPQEHVAVKFYNQKMKVESLYYKDSTG